MTEDVKPRRRYNATRRQAQAAQTRQDILDAANRLFVEGGYAGTTLAAIARAAGVVVETIYRAYGSKAELFKAVVRAAVAGGAARAQVPVEQRPAIAAMIAEPDPHRQLQLYAATQPGIHARAGPLLRVLVGAAATDPELAELWTQIENERLNGQGRLTQLLADRGVLRPELPVQEASTTCSSCSGDGRPGATATGWPPPWPEPCWPTANRRIDHHRRDPDAQESRNRPHDRTTADPTASPRRPVTQRGPKPRRNRNSLGGEHDLHPAAFTQLNGPPTSHHHLTAIDGM
jgi:AcrR family transcriptional regulator